MLMPASGGPATPLAADRGVIEIFPRWSPDGSQIAFAMMKDGSFEIGVVSATGGAVRRLTTTPDNEEDRHWTPDGRTLVYQKVPRDHKIVTVDVSGLLRGGTQ